MNRRSFLSIIAGSGGSCLIPAAISRRIHDESAGSPLFACELLHHLADLVAGAGGAAVAAAPAATAVPTNDTTASGNASSTPVKKKKLSYKEQRDLDELPGKIEAYEKEQAEIQKQLADGSLYVSDAAKAQALNQRHAEIDDLLLVALERWENLSAN